LCDEVHLNLGYRWFCRLGLEDQVPDHSTFSLNRHGRFREAQVLRSVFEGVVRRCMAHGLVGGEGFAIDASVMEADASRYKGVPGNLPPDGASTRHDMPAWPMSINAKELSPRVSPLSISGERKGL
jgi:IS5 family transposase